MMNDAQPLGKQEVQLLLEKYSGNLLFKRVLQESSAQDISQTVAKYVCFNRLFGASVASLASRLAQNTNLFLDNKETSDLWNDRSMEVASSIFAAAIDEFGDRGFSSNPTHRMLAQATVKGLDSYSRLRIDDINKDSEHIRTTFDPQVCNGYGVNARLDEHLLFKSVGFHIGSELLADGEFRILDSTLREKYPKLVRYLENTTITISGNSVPAYRWIGIHTTVEIDHFDHALHAANISLQYYGGSQQKSEVRKQIFEGVEEFAIFQEGFMKYLSERKRKPT